MIKRIWDPPIFLTSASVNKGFNELYDGIWRHHRFLKENSRLEERRKKQLEQELRMRIENEFSRVLWKQIVKKKDISEIVDEVWKRQIDPQHIAQKIVSHSLARLVDQERSGEANLLSLVF